MRPHNKVIFSALFILLGVPMAFAHAVLTYSSPADQSVIHSRGINVILDFNSRIDASRSTLILTGPAEKNVPLHIERSSKPFELKATASNLAIGTYHIHWQVLAGDGHITRGDIAFTVAKN